MHLARSGPRTLGVTRHAARAPLDARPAEWTDARDAQVDPFNALARLLRIGVAVGRVMRSVEARDRHVGGGAIELPAWHLDGYLPGLAEVAQVRRAHQPRLISRKAL